MPRQFQVGDVVRFRGDYWRAKIGGNCEHYSVCVQKVFDMEFNGVVIASQEPRKKIGDTLNRGCFDAFELVNP